jgi:hypothetical protein
MHGKAIVVFSRVAPRRDRGARWDRRPYRGGRQEPEMGAEEGGTPCSAGRALRFRPAANRAPRTGRWSRTPRTADPSARARRSRAPSCGMERRQSAPSQGNSSDESVRASVSHPLPAGPLAPNYCTMRTSDPCGPRRAPRPSSPFSGSYPLVISPWHRRPRRGDRQGKGSTSKCGAGSGGWNSGSCRGRGSERRARSRTPQCEAAAPGGFVPTQNRFLDGYGENPPPPFSGSKRRYQSCQGTLHKEAMVGSCLGRASNAAWAANTAMSRLGCLAPPKIPGICPEIRRQLGRPLSRPSRKRAF